VRSNPQANHILFTNVNPPILDGFDVRDWLSERKIRIVNLRIEHRLPAGSVNSWGNQFYILDIIKFASNESTIDSIFVLDSDCIWIRSARAMQDAVMHEGLLTYELWYDQDHVVNGMSRRMMMELYTHFFGEPPRNVPI
jgi:hypothetical protein